MSSSVPRTALPLIRNLDRLINNLRGIARNKGIDVLAAGGTQNHVHLLLRLPPVRPVSESMRDLKANSSRCRNETSGRFAWQDGYAAISVSPSQAPMVRPYIENQDGTMRYGTSRRSWWRSSTNQEWNMSASI